MELFKNDMWLAQYLDKPCFSFLAESVDHETLASELAAFQQDRHDDFFLFTKVSTSSVQTVAALEQSSFKLVDTNVQLILNAPWTVSRLNSDVVVREASDADKDAIARVAGRSFKYSRFHLDPNVPNETADELKSAWTQNYFLGKRGDNMVVAELDKEVVGFVQLFELDDQFIIDLIAVDTGHHKKGIGRELVEFCSSYYSKFSSGLVGTQISNTPSINLYEKCGYRFKRSSYVFHYHHKTKT